MKTIFGVTDKQKIEPLTEHESFDRTIRNAKIAYYQTKAHADFVSQVVDVLENYPEPDKVRQDMLNELIVSFKKDALQLNIVLVAFERMLSSAINVQGQIEEQDNVREAIDGQRRSMAEIYSMSHDQTKHYLLMLGAIL